MTEAYVIEATLEWKTNVLEVLRQMARGFEEVNNLVVGLGDALKELTASNRGVSSLAKQLEKLRVAPGVMDDMRQLGRTTADLVAQQRELADSAKQSAAAWREMADASRRVRMPGPGGAGSRSRGGGHVAAMDAAMGAQMTGDFGMGLLERGFHEYADVQLQQVMAQSDKKVTDAVLARANALVQTLQKQYPGLTQSEGLTLFRNTMGIFGDPNESLDALPGAARLQQLYQLAPLGRGGTGGSEVRAAEKAGDALQAFINPQTGRLDKGLYEQWMNFQARSYQAGGGLVDAKGWLAFARTSRSAGIGLSPHALEEAQALLEMSPGRTGTALMSAFQVFGASTKHMTKSNRSAWHDMGLLTKSGDIIDRAGYQDDPFQWVWNDLLPHLAAKGVKTREQVLKWLTENGQRSTVSGILADIAIGRTPITNTAAKMDRQDSNLVDKLVNSDTGKLAALQAAETNFFVALGKFTQGPGLALINNLAQGMNNLADAMNAHPDAARRIIEIGGGLALLSKIAGDSAMAYLFVGGPLVGGLKSLAGAYALCARRPGQSGISWPNCLVGDSQSARARMVAFLAVRFQQTPRRD
jgi:hypothetical protein